MCYRIVYHRTDHQYQSKQRDQVDTETRQCHKGKRTDQRNNNTDQRNQRGTNVLQEDIHHQDYQNNRFNQRLDYLINRSIQEVIGTHQLCKLYPFR